MAVLPASVSLLDAAKQGDFRLTTADGASSANGHCTFYFSTGTGLCSYQNGGGELAGFRAELAVGTVNAKARMYSVIGKYWLGGSGA